MALGFSTFVNDFCVLAVRSLANLFDDRPLPFLNLLSPMFVSAHESNGFKCMNPIATRCIHEMNITQCF